MYFFDEANFVRNAQDLPMRELFYFLPIGYLVTILVETPILVAGLSRKLSLKQRILCGVWLTACTYPVVVLVLPAIFFGSSRFLYLTVAEIFAPAADARFAISRFAQAFASTKCSARWPSSCSRT